MADLLEATESSLARKVDGKEYTFSFLTAYDRSELLRSDLAERQKAWKDRRTQLVADLNEAGITGEQKFAELQAFDEKTPYGATEGDWIALVNDPTKEVSIYAASLRHKHGPNAEEIAKQARLSLSDKAKICGLSLVSEREPGPNPPAPTIPEAYGTTGQS